MIYPEFRKFVNLCPHDIVISGHAILPKSENPCRVETQQMIIGKLAGIPIVKTEFIRIINLPDPENGTYYIASRLCMDYIPFGREDVFCVDTGSSAVRDENGRIVAVTQLSI